MSIQSTKNGRCILSNVGDVDNNKKGMHKGFSKHWKMTGKILSLSGSSFKDKDSGKWANTKSVIHYLKRNAVNLGHLTEGELAEINHLTDKSSVKDVTRLFNRVKVAGLRTEAEEDSLVARYDIFGKKQWEQFGVSLGAVPSLPADIEDFMEGPSLSDGKTRGDVFKLVLIPGKVNGKKLTLKYFEQLSASFPLTDASLKNQNLIRESLRNPPENHVSGESFWSLLERNKTYFGDDFD